MDLRSLGLASYGAATVAWLLLAALLTDGAAETARAISCSPR